MEKLLVQIKEEALKNGCSIWEIYDRLKSHLPKLQEELNEEMVIQEKLNPFNYYYIDKEDIYWIYQSEEKFQPNEKGEVILQSIAYYDESSVLLDDLVPLSFEDYSRLVRLCFWDDERFGTTKDGYEEEVERIFKRMGAI